MALLIGGVAYALGAATTTPFTLPADVMVAVPLVALAVLVVVRWPRSTKALRPSRAPSGHPNLGWGILLAVFSGWELFNYLVHGSRANHPTLSSMTDAVDRYYALKVLLFLAWLALGWMMVDRGTRSAV
jgi:hypothetical protein